jgi:VWFA-related protein
MTRKFIIAFLLAAAILTHSATAFAQDQSGDEVIKVETTFISVPVIVSDRQGRYIGNLTAKDFSLYQDGVKQNIDFFAPTEEPLNVALLIDTSRSTAPVLDDIKDAAIDFIEQLQPRDRATIVSFDYETKVLAPLTSDRNRLIRAVEDAEIGEYVGTTLRDAVMETVTRSLADIKGRKAIILLTDGKDARSQVSIEELRHATEESDAMIYSIFYRTGRNFNADNRRNARRNRRFSRRFPNIDPFPQRFPDDDRAQQRGERVARANAEAEDFLQQLSDSTAGRFYRSEVEDLNQTFKLIIDELRFQYRLGFYPLEKSGSETSHEIKVQVARAGAVVRARKNYRAEQPQPAKQPADSNRRLFPH